MIILKLRGALGNQMFQYAFGRSLAIEKRQLLFIDDTSLDSYAKSFDIYRQSRMYKLGYFRIKALRLPFRSSRIISILRFFGRKFERIEKIDNQDPIYDEKLLRIAKEAEDVYIDGHWFSEEYFIKNVAEIRKDFNLDKYMKTVSQELIEDIETNNSVFLHIRRGDYISNSEVAKKQNIVKEDYYKRAIDYIVRAKGDIKIFVFSDDIKWVKKNFKIGIPMCFIDGDVNNPIQDLFLMSKCKHSIITNSTFSWWGAWLNNNEDKVIISPKHWFANDIPSAKDIIPKDWVKL